MNADRLLALFEPISEAPDSIPRLRRFILDLAVRGKLVEQDPEDEPAEELLQRLKPAKSLAYELEGLRKRQPVNSVSRDDLWFDIPAAWALPCFDDLLVIVSGVTKGQRIPPSEAVEAPYLRVANVQRGSLALSQIKTISVRASDVKRYRLEDQDILMTEGGDWDKLGRAAIWGNQIPGCIHQNHVFRLRVPTDELMPDWVVLYANSDPGRKFFEDCSKQTTNLASINLTQLRSCPLPLPPLAEQHRIVAKVDELMALCDQLEAARQQREQCRERLVAASLQRLNQLSEDPEAFRSDARFALHVLPSLTSTPAQIKQLRQTILNLAVRGKLVEQDQEDEPAEDLVTRIVAAKSKKGRDDHVLRAGSAEDDPLRDLPKGWAWTSFEGYSLSVNTGPFGTTLPQSDYIEGGIPLVNPSHMRDQIIVCDPRVSVSEQTAARLSSYRLSDGDLVIARRGEVGRVALVGAGEDGWICGTGSFFASFAEEVPRDYLLLFMLSSFARGFLGSEGIGATMTNLNQKILKRLPIPIPPLAEQHRIVAKVDELMALCDQLEQQLNAGEQLSRKLLEAVLTEALAGRLPERP